MRYAVCKLSVVPLRKEPSDLSEMLDQLLFGDFFEVVEIKGSWCKIQLQASDYPGWVSKKQIQEIGEEDYFSVLEEIPAFSGDLVEFVDGDSELIPVVLGTRLNALHLLNKTFTGTSISGQGEKSELVDWAYAYLHSPFLHGGRTPFGIDAAGFIQMVYRLAGHVLPRSAAQQSRVGENLSFIEESEPGDIVFFDDQEGQINHVGLLLEDNHIIHADGQVRLDRIDHSGIFNQELRRHTHQLRVIKRIF